MHLDDLIQQLDLIPHPEGGLYRETFRSPMSVSTTEHSGARCASTAIYFLLPAGRFSAFHRVRSDEVWHHYEGDPLELHLIDARGVYERIVLGHDYSANQRPQAVVPAGICQAARTLGDRFALCGCTVAPGFEFADFEMPVRAEMVASYPAHREIIEALTRAS
jgi:uncharacterized protein